MRIIEITEPGGPEVLRLSERPIPTPGDNEVLIRIHAAGINRPEVLQRKGLYPPPPGATDIPGLEAAGVVAAIGANVERWREGDEICALLPGGGYGDYALVDAGSCLPKPAALSFEEAACLPETIFTVWANVVDDAQLLPGETLLVHGGTSGIGATAITLAKAMGAKVVATAGTDAKRDACLQIGADQAFNYTSDTWDAEIRETGGADVVLDMTGGDFIARNQKAMAEHGRHVSIAFLRGPEGAINVFDMMRRRLRFSGSTMKSRPPEEKARLAGDIERHVWPLIEAGKMRPIMDKAFTLDQVADAHKRMESGDHIGKIVLKVA